MNDSNFKSFKTKLLGNTAAVRANRILKDATITLSLKGLSYFWRSLERPLINSKVELKFN